jgi:hypothetical protein
MYWASLSLPSDPAREIFTEFTRMRFKKRYKKRYFSMEKSFDLVHVDISVLERLNASMLNLRNAQPGT